MGVSIIKMFFIVNVALQCFIPFDCALSSQSDGQSRIGVKNPSLLKVMRSGSSTASKADSSKSSLHDNFLRSSGFGGPAACISMRSDLFFGYEKYRLTRVESMLEGAQMGAKIGLLMSAVGTTAGLWDEKDSWYLVGALSALGVLLRGTTMDDEPQWRIRLNWEPERSARGVRPLE